MSARPGRPAEPGRAPADWPPAPPAISRKPSGSFGGRPFPARPRARIGWACFICAARGSSPASATVSSGCCARPSRGTERRSTSSALPICTAARSSASRGGIRPRRRSTRISPSAIASLIFPNGFSVEAQPAEAFRWCRAAAEQGLVDAQAQLGFLYARGIGVDRDFAEARRGMRSPPSAAMPRPNSVSASSMRTGFGVAADPRDRRLVVRAIRGEGQRRRADRAGADVRQRPGSSADPARAAALLEQAAERGHPRAHYHFALHLLDGTASPKTASWRKRICARPRSPATRPAMVVLARLHGDGFEAAQWWRAAANAGDPEAQFTVA